VPNGEFGRAKLFGQSSQTPMALQMFLLQAAHLLKGLR
jgi:hypothetical protein